MPIDNSTRFPKPLAADLRELSEGMAIVIDGETAPKAIASGQYLFIKNHSTLATGGYHATAAIASGADITSSNVTADADGIVNGAFSSLSEQIVPYLPTPWTGNMTATELNNLKTPGIYRRYVTSNMVDSIPGGWVTIIVSSVSGYSNYGQTLIYDAGLAYARGDSGNGWTTFVQIT